MPATDLCGGDTHSLTKAHHHRYLGVTLTSDLSWSLHIANICKKTRKQIGLLNGNLYQFADSSILLKLYISLVKPLTEYAFAIWDLHLFKDILGFEKFALESLSQELESWLWPSPQFGSSPKVVYKEIFKSTYAGSFASSQGRLLTMIPHLLDRHHPILTDSRTLYNCPLYMHCQYWYSLFHHLYWGLKLITLWCCQQELFVVL